MSYIARTSLTNKQADRKLEKNSKIKKTKLVVDVSRVVLSLAWISSLFF